MLKTLKMNIRQQKESFKIPRSVQDLIPIKRIYSDGIFKTVGDMYTKSFKFEDINYQIAAEDDQQSIFLKYSDLLNSFDSATMIKITVNNRKIDKDEIMKNVMIPSRDDGLEEYRTEYNKILYDKAFVSSSIVQDKYITVSIFKNSIEDARAYFSRCSAQLRMHFRNLGSKLKELDIEERLKLLYDFYRSDDDSTFNFDIAESAKIGRSFKDYISSDSMEIFDDHFKTGEKFGRVLFLKDRATNLKDDVITNLTDVSCDMMLSIDILPIPTDEALKLADDTMLGVDTNLANWQRRQNANYNFSAMIPYDMELQRKETKDFLNDLMSRNQKMLLSVITVVHLADSKEQLDRDTDAIKAAAKSRLCQLAVLKWQQMDGVNTTLPIGVRKLNSMRSLTTESLSAHMPFRVREIVHKNGIYYGENAISKNLLVINRMELMNGNSYIIGVSGSGKSFIAKHEIESLRLRGDADIIIIDPEREYWSLVKSLKGEVIRISATSKNHINAMDINQEYGDGSNPLVLKSGFILSLCEQLAGGHIMGPKEKSIVDRCIAKIYRDYQSRGYRGTVPTLKEFYFELMLQPEEEARNLALAIELFTHGSLNTFAQETNVDTSSSFICYDILDLGKQLMPIGMLVVLDSILNRITSNRAKGRKTFIFIDEIYLLFQYEYSTSFLFTLWKRVRKYGAFCTGITQNVEDLLQSHTARTMLANSEFLIILNQAPTDRAELGNLIQISDHQMKYIQDVPAGRGLMKVGNALVPFENNYPKNNKLYRMMTTKPGESETEEI